MLDNKLLKEFGDIETLARFLREAINDGEQISKGKSPDEKSKEEKEDDAGGEKPEAPEKPEAEEPEADEGGEAPAAPEGGDAAAAAAAGAEEPIVDPVAMPGSQVAMGGITRDGKKDKVDEPEPNSVKIEVSGKKDKVKMHPVVDTDPSQYK